MSWLINRYSVYSHSGIQPNYSPSVVKSHIFFNQILLLMVITTISFVGFFFLQGLYLLFYITATLFGIYIAAYIFNKTHFHFLARLIVLWCTYIVLLLFSYFYGKDSGFHYALIYMTSIPLFIFHIDQILWISIYMIIPALFFLMIESQLLFFNPFLLLNPDQVLLMNISMSFGTLFCLIGSLFMFFQLYSSTERSLQKSLADKQLLLKEIHHRVKNNLQIISSLLELQSLRIDSPITLTVYKEMLNRIQSMALIHQSLYSNDTLSSIRLDDYLFRLTQLLQSSFYQHHQQIEFSIKPDLSDLSIDQAIPCGLIINELVTNSYKYAFVNRQSGLISITITHPHNNVVLTVADNGCGLPDEFNPRTSESIGMQIVYDLVSQLNGTISYTTSQKTGTQFVISFPLETHYTHD